jgi:DNA-binding SARP family transcriptional activator/WD40 repeat protein
VAVTARRLSGDRAAPRLAEGPRLHYVGPAGPPPTGIDFRILGPLEVLDDGRTVPLGGTSQRALLGLLLLHPNETLSTDRLIEELWGEDPPTSAAKAVHARVSRLRKALASGDGNGSAELVVTRERGYELKLDPERVDLHRFERLVADGRSELAAGRPECAASALERALSLWRGAPLADLAYERFAQPEIARLENLRVAALEQLIEAKLGLGRHPEVIPQLETLIAEHPYRENLRAQLMLALYRCDRQADALQAYQDARRALIEQLGIEPGERLRQLEQAILTQDPALAGPAGETAELPPELGAGTLLVGRDSELDRLREHWRRARDGAGRLMLLAGGAGMGKTRLAAELAVEVQRERGEVLYVSGTAPADTALAALAGARDAGPPRLVVLDDVDRASGQVRAALSELLDGLAELPVLVLATAEHPTLAPALGACTSLALGPLEADAVHAVAQLYAGASDDVQIPVERLAAVSGGVPRRVHRAATEWARSEAARRLGLAAERAASERTGLRAAEEDLAVDVAELQALQERAALEDSEREVIACPFKGLASFDIEDAEVFFGRERLVAEMVARLAGAPLMGIVGSSGSGKSSVLRAGLLAALAAGVLPGSVDWGLALLRPGEHPARALDHATAGEAARRSRLVLAIDQFEEIFTSCRDEAERAAFVDELVVAARDPRRRALVLVAVRADFYGRCAAYPELSRLLGANHVLVGPMRRDELRRAIELPARRAGLRIDSDVVDALIADVEGEPGALPLLSTSLLELWKRRDGRRLRMSAYEQTGGVHGAIAQLAENAYARLEPTQRGIARRILLRLAGHDEEGWVVRRRVGLVELDVERDERAAEVLAVLADDRLVTIGEGEVEIAHEALLREWPRLRRWLEEDTEGRRLHQHLGAATREWDAAGSDPGELYRGARLTAALEWAADHGPELNARERAFLDASHAANERSHRRLRAVLAGVAALLALSVIAGVVALEQRGSAREQAVAADAQRLGARALVEDDLDRALLLARQGVALDDSAQTRGNLLAALLRSPATLGLLRGDDEPITTIALSPDERTLAAGTNSDKIFLFDTRTRRRLATLTPTSGNAFIGTLAFSPDGRRLAIGYDRGRGNVVAVFDLRGRRVVARPSLPLGRLVSGLRYSPDGRTLELILARAFGDRGPAEFMRFDARTGTPRLGPVSVNRAGTTSLMITSDGRRLVAVGEGETVVRDAQDLRALKRWPVGGRGASQFWPTALAPDDRTVAIGGEDGSVRLLDLETGKQRAALGRHVAEVFGARFTPDSRRLVTTGADNDVIVWNVQRAAALETLTGQPGRVLAPQITRDGRTLYTAGPGAAVFIWDLLGTRRLGRPFSTGAPSSAPGFAAVAPGQAFLALSSDGRLIARGQDDGGISIIDGHTLARRRPFPVVTTGPVHGLAFVPGSHVLVVSGPKGFLALADADTGRVLERLPGHGGNVLPPAVSGDGRSLVTGSDDATVRMWSLPTTRAVGAPLRFGLNVKDVQISPNARWLTIVLVGRSGENRTLEVWDARRRRRVARLSVPDTPTAVRFSPDSRLLAVGYPSGRSHLWSTANWKPVTRLLAGDVGDIYALAISPNRNTLATAAWTAPCGCGTSKASRRSAGPFPDPGAAWARSPRTSRRTAPRSSPAMTPGAPTAGTSGPSRSNATPAESPAGASRAPNGPSSYPAATTTQPAEPRPKRSGRLLRVVENESSDRSTRDDRYGRPASALADRRRSTAFARRSGGPPDVDQASTIAHTPGNPRHTPGPATRSISRRFLS